jgi:hypothetical protein
MFTSWEGQDVCQQTCQFAAIYHDVYQGWQGSVTFLVVSVAIAPAG